MLNKNSESEKNLTQDIKNKWISDLSEDTVCRRAWADDDSGEMCTVGHLANWLGYQVNHNGIYDGAREIADHVGVFYPGELGLTRDEVETLIDMTDNKKPVKEIIEYIKTIPTVD